MNTYDDNVNGIVIGGDFGRCWVTYCGRKQGPTKYPQNELEAWGMCRGIVDGLKNTLGSAFIEIYPKKEWVFHFDGI